MPYPINFNKAQAERFLAALRNGTAIDAPPEGWSINDMMALGGACFFAAMSHGPILDKVRGIDTSKLPHEHREAREDTLMQDLHDAIEFYGQLTSLVADSRFDPEYEPNVVALVFTDADGKKQLIPHKGFKGR